VLIADKLGLTNRIHCWYDNNLTLDQSLCIGLNELRHQMVQRHGAWHFVRVNCRLDVKLRPRALAAESQALDATARTRGHGWQRDGKSLNAHLKLLKHKRDA
jgi:hypothetical protein